MSKKARILVVTLAVLLTALVIPTAVAMAQNDGTAGTPRSGQILSRVAEILGIEQEQLEDAFAQAREEMREEAGEWSSGNCTQEQWQSGHMIREKAGTGEADLRGLKGMRGRHMAPVAD